MSDAAPLALAITALCIAVVALVVAIMVGLSLSRRLKHQKVVNADLVVVMTQQRELRDLVTQSLAESQRERDKLQREVSDLVASSRGSIEASATEGTPQDNMVLLRDAPAVPDETGSGSSSGEEPAVLAS